MMQKVWEIMRFARLYVGWRRLVATSPGSGHGNRQNYGTAGNNTRPIIRAQNPNDVDACPSRSNEAGPSRQSSNYQRPNAAMAGPSRLDEAGPSGQRSNHIEMSNLQRQVSYNIDLGESEFDYDNVPSE